jgi:hypothetical protein
MEVKGWVKGVALKAMAIRVWHVGLAPVQPAPLRATRPQPFRRYPPLRPCNNRVRA